MFHTQPVGFSADTDTWILVANRGGAKIFASDGGTRNLRLIEDIPHPKGRLKNRDIDADRQSHAARAQGPGTTGQGSQAYSRNGLVNKNETTFHEMQVFARELASLMQKGRSEKAYSKLVLVAEPRFLGELRATLDEPTRKAVDREIDRDLYNFDSRGIREHIEAHWLPT